MLRIVLAIAILSSNVFAFDYNKFGTVLVAGLAASSFGATLLLDDKEGQKYYLGTFGANVATTMAIKYAINRKRPDGDDYSFPSGHTSVAFQSAAFIHKRYGFRYAVPMYVAAAVVGYTRIKAKRHYISDVIAGAALGTLIGYTIPRRNKDIMLTAGTNRGLFGVMLFKRW